jgi:ATP-dependent DNA helicase PIF1
MPAPIGSHLSDPFLSPPVVHLSDPFLNPLPRPEPPIEMPPVVEPRFAGELTDMAVSDADWQLLTRWDAYISQLSMEFCCRCQRKWFGMELYQRVCKTCRQRDNNKGPNEPFFFSRENDLDFGIVPAYLPPLTQVEEMLIARVHVHVQVFQYRGQQYKYRGHCISFLRDVGSIYSQLPLLPTDLDIIILRPQNATTQPHVIRQFRNQFRVRQSHIRIWLDHLRRHHPGYRDITISEAHLSQLPTDGDVTHQLPTEATQDVDIEDEVAREDIPDDDDYECAAVPNLLAAESDLEQLRSQVMGNSQRHPEQVPLRANLEMPAIRRTPLSEFNRSQAMLSLAFPSIFPNGEAEFVSPRQRTIDFSQYLEHAMKWHDGRFARHPRFRFVVFNKLMRGQVNQRSAYYMKMPGSATRQTISVEDLREAFSSDSPEAKSLLNSIVRYSASLRGTRPFWMGRRHQLEAYCHALGCPAAFITLSPADIHWDSQQRLMPRYGEWRIGDNRTRYVIAAANLRDNPLIAAHHFHYRFKSFMEMVMKPKFGIVDYWYRYEWQARGSPHTHGLFWMAGSPCTPLQAAEEIERFVQHWTDRVSAFNPEPERDRAPPGDGDPLISLGEAPTFQLLSDIVNRVQRHKCSEAYCLRRRRHDGGGWSEEKYCRFYFPRPSHDEAIVTHDFNPQYLIFDGSRNDTTLNNYNRVLALGWRANHDISPCTDLHAVIAYIAKYVSKTEVKTQSFQDIAKEILPKVTSRRPLVSFAAKIMNKALAERDWSAMEVSHLLLNLPLQEGSRTVRPVDCRPHDGQASTVIHDDGSIQTSKSLHQKYIDRELQWEGLAYFDFLTRFDFQKRPWRRFPRADPRVLNYFPRYKPDPEGTAYEDFCRVKLLLHHPHRSTTELLVVDGEQFDRFSTAYQRCRSTHEHEDDYYGDLPEVLPDQFEETVLDGAEDTIDGWNELAGQLPQPGLEVEDVERLGNRDLDLCHDWSPHIGQYPSLEDIGPEYWDQAKAEFIGDNNPILSSSVFDQLNAEQRLVFDLFTRHYEESLSPVMQSPPQLLLQVDGQGGTGKTFLIHAITSRLRQLSPGDPAVIKAAPTGVAACAIDGESLHSLLKIPVKQGGITSELSPLSPSALSSLQARLRAIRYIIIDEKSMVGLRLLAYIDFRLREAFPSQQDEFFGGRSILLLGDFYQLPPVKEKPIFLDDTLSNVVDIKGRNAYLQFNKTVVLRQVVRQQGNDQAAFRVALEGLRSCCPSVDNWQVLCTRVQSALSIAEVKSFDEAIRIFPTNAQVKQQNMEHLERLGLPCIQIDAKNSPAKAKDADFMTAGRLENKLCLCIGARVMLTGNLWIATGLVNGAMGNVYDIAYKHDVTDPRSEPPFAILVKFDKYTGPAFFLQPELSNVVPIFQVTRDFLYGNVACTRKQFALIVAYSITVHKSQGMTLDKAVLDISQRDFAAGLSYVAVSRVKRLDGLMFDVPFDLEAILSASDKGIQARARDARRREAQRIYAI